MVNNLNSCFVKVDEEPEIKMSTINTSFFMNNSKETTLTIPSGNEESTSKPKKKTTRKSSKKEDYVKANPDNELSMTQSNTPYSDTYGETTQMLKNSVMEIDSINNELRNDIENIRSSKTIKKKYDYISEISSTRGSLLSTKISAIREINNAITNGHNLELKRIKELKLNETEKDDDKYIMDLYNAFISTPVGTPGAGMMSAPSMADISTMSGNINGIPLSPIMDSVPMSSVDNMMRLEGNSNIKTVVMYDSSTGNRWFDVIDTNTGQSIPNSEKPDQMFLEDTTLDIHNGIARNTNLDLTYPLIVINNNIMNEY